MKLSDTKIGFRISAAFGVVILAGGFSYLNMSGSMRSYMHSVSATGAISHNAISTAKDASEESSKMARETQAYVFTAEKSHWDAKFVADEAAAKAFKELEGLIKQLPNNKELLAQLEEASSLDESTCNPLENKTMEMAKAGNIKDATKLFREKYVPARTTLEQKIDALVGSLEQMAKKSDNDIVEGGKAAQASLTFSGFLQVGIVILCCTIAYLITKSISRPLQSLMETAGHLAEGDVDQQISIQSRDEVGKMAEAFRSVIAYQQKMAIAAESIADRDLTYSVTPKSDRDKLGNSFAKMVTNLRDIVGELTASANSVAGTSAKLSYSASQTGKSAHEIAATIQEVAGAASQSATTSQEMASASEQQARTATEAAGAMERLQDAITTVQTGGERQREAAALADRSMREAARSVEDVTRSTEQMAEAAQEASSVAKSGGICVEQTVASMKRIQAQVSQSGVKVKELDKKGQEIGAIVETIDQIAEQTNLLALNAAIEAARAGEHGKGFAVVADEVRKLAERATGATKEIGTLIASVRKDVEEVVVAMESSSLEVADGAAKSKEAGDALSQILAAANRVAEEVAGVSTIAKAMNASVEEVLKTVETVKQAAEEQKVAVSEMAAGSSEVNASITTVASISEETAAGAEEMSASAQEVSASAQNVATTVAEQTASIEQVSGAAVQLNEMAARLQVLVQQFKMEHNESQPAGLRLAA